MKQEIFPIVDETGRVIGKETRAFCHSGSKVLHPVVHLHVLNRSGELYLQKRSMSKDIQPGKWDTAVGGHVDYGETVLHALEREAREELGISGFTPHPVLQYVFESDIEKELVYTFITSYEGEPVPDASELDSGRFWPLDEITARLGKDIFTPNFEQEFLKLQKIQAFTSLNR